MAQPPGKRLSALTLLSGGEQALTAIALIFALFLTNPAPLCIPHEVHAPLDDANIARFCDLLHRMTADSATSSPSITRNATKMTVPPPLLRITMIEKGINPLARLHPSRHQRHPAP